MERKSLVPLSRWATSHEHTRVHSHEQRRYTLDVASDQTPPEITVHWPKPEDLVFARTCRIRGRTSERSVRVQAVCPDGTVLTGIPELSGHFWIHGVPLEIGKNTVTVSAADAAGNESTQELQITRHPVEIEIDLPNDTEKASRTPTITGTITDPNYVVWVNGTRAEMKGKRWVARSARLNKETGTTVLQAVAFERSVADSMPDHARSHPRLQDMGNPKR